MPGAGAVEPPDDIEQVDSIEDEKDKGIPPDGGYGWVCVACNALINAHTWGLNSTYGVFLGHYLNSNAFPGTSPLAYAFIGGLSISQALLVAPLGTYIIHRTSTRVCLNLGIFFETLSLVGASFSTELWQLVLSQGICFGWGMGFLFTASVTILPQWFLRYRSIANALAAGGSGIGAMIYSLAAGRAIQTIGLAWTFRMLAICVFCVNIVCANLIRDRNKQTGARHRAFDPQILKRPEFLLTLGWGWFSMLGYVVVVFSIPAYATQIGLTSQQGYILNAIVNLGQGVGRPAIGLSSDRFGRMNVALLCTLFAGISIFVFWIPTEAVSNSYALLIVYSLIGGALAGTYWATIAPVSAEVVGLQDLPGALSLTWLLLVPPTTVSQPIALQLRSLGQREWVYLRPQIFTGFMYVGGALCLLVLRGWKIGQVEEVERRVRAEARRQGRAMMEKDGGPAQEKKTESGDGAPGEGVADEIRQAVESQEEEAVKVTAAVIERVGTQDEVRKASWEWRDLLRRMLKVQKV
jgi:MFS family permease